MERARKREVDVLVRRAKKKVHYPARFEFRGPAELKERLIRLGADTEEDMADLYRSCMAVGWEVNSWSFGHSARLLALREAMREPFEERMLGHILNAGLEALEAQHLRKRGR